MKDVRVMVHESEKSRATCQEYETVSERGFVYRSKFMAITSDCGVREPDECIDVGCDVVVFTGNEYNIPYLSNPPDILLTIFLTEAQIFV